MTFYEYIDSCYTVKYSKCAKIEKFGDPMNCYGFVYWAYKLCFNIELESNNVTSFDSIHVVKYNRVENPVNGDVVNLRTTDGNNCYHVGIVFDDIIYHFTCAGLMSKSRFRMANWIKGYYHVASSNT